MKVTLEELYEFSKIHDIRNKVQVKTKFGYKNIEEIAVTEKNSDYITFTTQSGIKVGCSPEHLFWDPEIKNWKKANLFKIGEDFEVKDGRDAIINIEHSKDKKDLLDIQVKEVKEFYANGIRSHNSTIAKALKFVLFGKVDGIRLSDIPNRINKAAWGRVTLIAKGSQIIIERGHSPSVFKLIIDGIEFDQAGKRDVQKYLEEEFLGFNFNVFTNILILSINDFKSFLTMTPRNKREIIDKIFGFYIINEMKERVKKDKKELRLNLARIEEALNQIDSTIKHTLERIENLKKKSNKENKAKSTFLENEIQQLNEKRITLKTKYDKLSEKISSIRKDKSSVADIVAELKEKNRTLQKTLKLYENSACPTCQSPLDTPFHKEIIETKKEEIQSVKNQAIEMKSKIESLDEDLTKAFSFEKTMIQDIQKLDSTVESKKREILSFAEANNNNTAELKALITEFERQKSTKSVDLQTVLEKETFLSILEDDILAEDGVKGLAIKAVVPVLNKTIEKFSKELNSQFNIEFNENFDCLIKHLGVEINPNTLSEGERKKADLIIIIAMIEILKLRYPQMNLLFLDELFSSLDQENISKILYVLKHMLEALHINIFVISHTELPVQMFDKIVHVTKKSNFSVFNVYTDISQVPTEAGTDK